MRILISGASIAGPTAAYWLARRGHRVTVLEKAPELRSGGQAIDVRGPALEVLDRMGVLDTVRAQATGLAGMSVLDGDGTEIQRSTEHTASGGPIDSPDVEILREDIARILVAAGNGLGIEYLFGDSVATLVQDGDTVRVGFRDAPDEREFDLVVGADGIHSVTRALAFGPEEDCLEHLGGYLAGWTAPNHLGLTDWEVIYRTDPKTSNGIWGGMVMTVRGSSELRVFVGISEDTPPAAFLPRDVETQKQLLLDRCRDVDLRWEMPRLLADLPDAPGFHMDATAQIHLDAWTCGRVALLGDAAWCASPASGQGTSLAVIGGYVLAGEIAAAGDRTESVPEALAAFENELRQYVADTQQLAHDTLDRPDDESFAEDGPPANFYEVVNSLKLKDYEAAVG